MNLVFQNGKISEIGMGLAKLGDNDRLLNGWAFTNNKHGDKNLRIVESILNGKPFVFLTDNLVDTSTLLSYSFVEVLGVGKMPFKVLLDTFRVSSYLFVDEPDWLKYFRFAPIATIPTNTKVVSSNQLLMDVVSDVMHAIEDEKQRIAESWTPNDEIEWVRWGFTKERIDIQIRASRNPDLARNGGDYNYYHYYDKVEGGILKTGQNSCDFDGADHVTPIFYPTKDIDLEIIGQTAERLVGAFISGVVDSCSCPTCGHVYARSEIGL